MSSRILYTLGVSLIGLSVGSGLVFMSKSFYDWKRDNAGSPLKEHKDKLSLNNVIDKEQKN